MSTALIAGCGGGGRDPILGVGGVAVLAPTVIAVTPAPDAVGVTVDNPSITATFSEAMQPLVGSASFVVTCSGACSSPIGTVALDASQRVATFSLAAGTSLSPSTTYTATITGARSQASGLPLDQPYVWTFSTGVRPMVSSTQPATSSAGTTGVAVTTAISAVFTDDIQPSTLTASTFTLACAAPCTAPSGTVSYTAATRTGTFTPSTSLAAGTTYTVTVTKAVTNLVGSALAGNQAAATVASDYVWTFTTAATVVTPPPPNPSPPTVTATAPVANATGVAPNNTVINAQFSEPVAPITGSASFTVTCAAPCSNPSGTVSLDSSNRIATYTLTASTSLQASTLYTATVTGAKSLATGLTMAAPYVWQFTTGAAPDTTRPRVTVTQPATSTPGPTANVATNTAISAVFTEDMAPATITASSFTVTCASSCTSPAGSVSYAVGTRMAVFTPTAVLAAGTTYTVTITTAATDLAGNALAGNQAALPAASNYVWQFTTTAAAPPPPAANITVTSTSPASGATAVCPSASINASFNVPSGTRLDPNTVTTATFTVTGPGPAFSPVAASSVLLDSATGLIATFTPQAALSTGTTYVATIVGDANGVKDLATPANTMVGNYTWTFTVGPATGNCLQPVSLGSASTFGDYGGSAGMTNQGLQTIINGDIGTTGASTTVTGFHDAGTGCTYTETTLNMGLVNGTIYTAAPPPTPSCPSEGTATTYSIAQKAGADALQAYNTLAALPPGPDPGAGSLAGLVLAPGVYTSAAGSFTIQGSDLTLDAQGNANAVWVFQMATSLTVGGPGAAFPQNVNLVNGAQAKNVFWQVGTAATINAAGGGTFSGTVISQTGVVVSTAGNNSIVTINGRALSVGASVTLVNTVINVPAP
jgi:hypothetical protein